jgi:hypothetical protein
LLQQQRLAAQLEGEQDVVGHDVLEPQVGRIAVRPVSNDEARRVGGPDDGDDL